jgi:signal transduction histidine kinase
VEAQEKAKGLSLSVDLPEKLPPVNIDSRRIGEVLRNLLENAVAHTGKGDTIKVTARQLDKLVEISVTDSGEGIPAKELPNIFERFYRVDKSRSRSLGGTGLGLAIVKHIAIAHGGRVAVESSPGKGSAFSILLPAP